MSRSRNDAGATDHLLGAAVARLFDIADDAQRGPLADWRYPEPEEAHPVSAASQARKLAAARAAAGATEVSAMAHGYGPVDDFARRYATAWRATGGKVWVNRYGYLADAKLDAIGAVVRGAASA